MFCAMTLVLLFLLKIRFWKNRAILQILSSRYGISTLKVFRNFNRLWQQLEKVNLDLEFLESCNSYNIVIRFKRKALTLWITLNWKKLARQWRNAWVPWIARAYCYGTTQTRHYTIKQTQRILEQKLHKLGIARETNVLEPYKVIFKFSSRVLSAEQKQNLSLGLDYSIPVGKLRCFKYYSVYKKITKIFRPNNHIQL